MLTGFSLYFVLLFCVGVFACACNFYHYYKQKLYTPQPQKSSAVLGFVSPCIETTEVNWVRFSVGIAVCILAAAFLLRHVFQIVPHLHSFGDDNNHRSLCSSHQHCKRVFSLQQRKSLSVVRLQSVLRRSVRVRRPESPTRQNTISASRVHRGRRPSDSRRRHWTGVRHRIDEWLQERMGDALCGQQRCQAEILRRTLASAKRPRYREFQSFFDIHEPSRVDAICILYGHARVQRRHTLC